jgi:hypothetical protein
VRWWMDGSSLNGPYRALFDRVAIGVPAEIAGVVTGTSQIITAAATSTVATRGRHWIVHSAAALPIGRDKAECERGESSST